MTDSITYQRAKARAVELGGRWADNADDWARLAVERESDGLDPFAIFGAYVPRLSYSLRAPNKRALRRFRDGMDAIRREAQREEFDAEEQAEYEALHEAQRRTWATAEHAPDCFCCDPKRVDAVAFNLDFRFPGRNKARAEKSFLGCSSIGGGHSSCNWTPSATFEPVRWEAACGLCRQERREIARGHLADLQNGKAMCKFSCCGNFAATRNGMCLQCDEDMPF